MKQQAFVSEILVDFTTKCYGSGQSDDLRGMVRKLLIDKIGLTIAGAKFPWSEGSYRATTAFPAQGRSTVIYFGDLLHRSRRRSSTRVPATRRTTTTPTSRSRFTLEASLFR